MSKLALFLLGSHPVPTGPPPPPPALPLEPELVPLVPDEAGAEATPEPWAGVVSDAPVPVSPPDAEGAGAAADSPPGGVSEPESLMPDATGSAGAAAEPLAAGAGTVAGVFTGTGATEEAAA